MNPRIISLSEQRTLEESIAEGLANQSVPAQSGILQKHADMLPKVAKKNDEGKADLSLIPYISNVEHAKAMMVGEEKYGRYNYEDGMTASRLMGALLRHANAWNKGEELDPDDGQHHLGSVMACCSMILRQQELGTLIDNRTSKRTK